MLIGRKMYIKWTDNNGNPFVIALEKLVGVKPEDVGITDECHVRLADVNYVDETQEITTLLKDNPCVTPNIGHTIGRLWCDSDFWLTQMEIVIEDLKKLQYLHTMNGTPYYNAIDIAISAIKKQIPTKPIYEKWSPTICANCGEELCEFLGDGYYKDWESLKICDCGQKLDWK